MLQSNSYNFKRLQNYAIDRTTQSIIRLLGKTLRAIQSLEKRQLSYEGQKAQSMARVYVTAACIELDKMIKAEFSYKI